MLSLYVPPPTYEQAIQLDAAAWAEIQLQPPLHTAQQPSQVLRLQQKETVTEQPQNRREERNQTFRKQVDVECFVLLFVVFIILFAFFIVICIFF